MQKSPFLLASWEAGRASTASLAANPCLRDAAVDFKQEGERRVAASLARAALQAGSSGWLSSPLTGGEALSSALLHPGAPWGRGKRSTGEQQSPASCAALCPVWCSGLAAFCDVLRFRWESRRHLSSLLPQAPPGVSWLPGVRTGLGAAPAEKASCPCCWQQPRSFFPCDKYGNRVCTRSELGINSIAQIGESWVSFTRRCSSSVSALFVKGDLLWVT